jgi:hypothetical protein
MKQRLMRLDLIAGQMNAWMIVIAIGLSVLDMTVLTAKCLPAVPVLPGVTGDAH